jgi:hypothetical protein
MTPLVLSTLIAAATRGLDRLVRYSTEFLAGIEEARAMALRYQTLAALVGSRARRTRSQAD